MRDIALSLLIPASLIYAMYSARGATLVLMWVGFQRPYEWSWGFWLHQPIWQFAFAIALISNLARKELKPKFPPLLVLYIIFVLWILLSCMLAVIPERSWLFFSSYMIPLLFGPILTFALINDLKMLKHCIWVAAGTLGLTAVKTGVSLSLSGGGHITEQITGFVGDNNVFGLTLCLVVATLMGLRHTIPNKRWLRALFFVGMAFVILTIIFTKSRGAIVTLGMIMFVMSILSGRPIRNFAICFMVCFLAYSVVPSDYFGRLETLQSADTVEQDESAMGRILNWQLAWSAAKDHPILGIGLGNHIPYHSASGVYGPLFAPHVAHSVYFQILGELGFIAFAMYMVFVFSVVRVLWKTWRQSASWAKIDPELAWLKPLSFWMLCGYIGYIVGSAFLNMLYIEFPWYFAFFAVMLRSTALRELQQRSVASEVETKLNPIGARGAARPIQNRVVKVKS